MGKILIVDDMAIFRDLIAGALRSAGYQALCAASAKEADALVKAGCPDLILLDIAMPGIDGLTWMEQLRRSPATAEIPIILLTAVRDTRCVVRASALRAQGYLLKSAFALDELLARVKKHVPLANEAVVPSNPSPAPADAKHATQPGSIAELPRLDRKECTRRAIEALPARTLGGIVSEVISEASSDRSDLSQLATTISRDVSLAARVLQTASSAAYANAHSKITNVHDAVRIIGSSTVRNIAISVGIFDAMPKPTQDGYNPIRCWQHSLAVARLCEHLFKLGNGADSGIAHIVGLCHDLGELVFRERFAPEYRAVMECHERTGRPRAQIERDVFGMAHGELVQTILHHFGLPAVIREPIQQFHNPPRPTDPPLVRILRMANAYANGLMLASNESASIAPFAKVYCRHATGTDDPPVPNADEFRNEIVALSSLLARLDAQSQRVLLVPAFPQSDVRIWLARDATLSEFDPVATFLKSVSQLTIDNRLPDSLECSKVDGLIAMAPTTTTTGLAASDLANLTPGPGTTKPPIFWMVGAVDPSRSVPKELPSPIVWPVPARDLANFVRSIATNRADVADRRVA